MNKFLWFAGGVVVGVGVSYRFIAKRCSEVAAEEINDAREGYRKLYLKKLKDDLERDEAAEKLIHEGAVEAAVALTNYQGGPVETEKPKAVRTPIDPGAKPPYVIGVEEFMRTEVGYEQISLTYFEGDETMTDISDEVLPPERVEQIIGEDNLTRFGELSEDDNVVYVRCEKFNMDFEVTRSTGKYSVEVLGLSEGE